VIGPFPSEVYGVGQGSAVDSVVVDAIVDTVVTGVVEVSVQESRVSLSLGLTLAQIVAVDEWVSSGVGDWAGVDQAVVVVEPVEVVVKAVVSQNVVVHHGVGQSSVGVHESWVSLSLGLTLAHKVGVDVWVSSGVGDWAGVDQGGGQAVVGHHGLGDLDDLLGDHRGDHGRGGGDLGQEGVHEGLVEVGGGLGVQVLGLGDLDGEGVVGDNSSVGVVDLGVDLGVGGSVKGCGHMDGGSVGEKDLGVGLGGGGGNSGQSGSDESLHGC